MATGVEVPVVNLSIPTMDPLKFAPESLVGMNQSNATGVFDVAKDLSERMDFFHLRALFYLISPSEVIPHGLPVNGSYGNETDMYPDYHLVPDYFSNTVPVFMLVCLLELFANFVLTGEGFRINDTLVSWSAGVLSHMAKLCVKSLNTVAYVWLFRHYRLTTLPLDTWWAWILAILATDCAYYWFHRASHEINIFWAAHQVHHSSEEFNLSVALRQSVVSNFGAWVFYLPMAVLGFTPTAFLIHQHFNLLYQFWIHTSLVKNLGVLELVLNTPSHHRAHHGRNPIYIDINYGGVFIIWDRLFGTFAPESPSEPAFYGLVGRLDSYNAIWVQIIRLAEIWRRMKLFPTIPDKLSAALKGPRWRPGLPFLGVLNRIPIREKEDHPEIRYDPQIPAWMTSYAVVHFLLVLPYFLSFIRAHDAWSNAETVVSLAHVTWSLANIGSVLDGAWWVAIAEVLRCGVMGLACSRLPGAALWGAEVVGLVRLVYGVSACAWMANLYVRPRKSHNRVPGRKVE
ncbi:alkylglycerol monooxygenase-like [Paramacrobiotus metropolitanus]|uniref:alkylglycerol monooxygenase-like n=1 Tax=Paramacrobiotus metropolitanus TaxID=2943436 RepID=UPI00244580EE|nr:alkylglycerol monooxygenase-like [Paramacrobiotus metropolitanus]